jgi:lipid A oxidase
VIVRSISKQAGGWPVALRATCAAAVLLAAAVLELAGLSTPAAAEVQIGVYGGMNGNFSSQTDLEKSGLLDSRTIDWDGKSFQMPPYWGVRGTYWFSPGSSWGLAFDYVHAKAYADLDFATDPTYSHLEFTDGINIATLNVVYRHDPSAQATFVPYVGLGAGIAVPHVEVGLKAFPAQKTWEYQMTGVAAQGLAGIEYRMLPSLSLFAEAKLSYSRIDADLAGGGSLQTDIWSPQFAIGLTYRFGGN